MPVTPQVQRLLETRAALNLPDVFDAELTVIRANAANGIAGSGIPEDIFHIEHRFINGPTADLPIRIYRPSDKPNLPAMVFFHGGGWVLATLDSAEQSLRSIANKGEIVIVSIGYQKAPEHPFPTPFDDCFAGLEWVIANAQYLGIDPSKIGVGGVSAGANLASGVALKARDQKIKLAFQMLNVPCNDNSMNYPSAVNNAEGYFLSTKAMLWFWDQYLQKPEDHLNPYAVPSRAQSFADLAPAIITTAEFDPLLDDGANYQELLEKAGVPTIYREFKGQLHGLINFGRDIPEAIELQQFLADQINILLTRGNK